jgi:hypothetical protein
MYPNQPGVPPQGYPPQGYPQQQQGYPQQGMPMQQMPQMRPRGPKGEPMSFIAFLGLHFITLGIYSIFWWVKVCREVNTFLGEERMSAWKMLLLPGVTCGIYMLIWQFSTGKDVLRDVQRTAGVPENVPWIMSPWRFQYGLNQVWQSIP